MYTGLYSCPGKRGPLPFHAQTRLAFPWNHVQLDQYCIEQLGLQLDIGVRFSHPCCSFRGGKLVVTPAVVVFPKWAQMKDRGSAANQPSTWPAHSGFCLPSLRNWDAGFLTACMGSRAVALVPMTWRHKLYQLNHLSSLSFLFKS